MNSPAHATEPPAQFGTQTIIKFFINQHSMKRTGILFTHGCEILCWGLLFLSNDVYSRHGSIELLFGLFYVYLYIRTVNLDVMIFSMDVDDRFYWNRLSLRQRTAVFSTIVLLNIIFIFPMMLFLTFEQMLLSILLLGLVLPALYKELYFFFIDLVLTKTANFSLNTGIYVSLKFLHMYFILLCSMILWLTWHEGFLHKFHSNNGTVKYHASTVDGNGIRKCNNVEYLGYMVHRKYKSGHLNLSKEAGACSAIPGEYVTFNCMIKKSDSNHVVLRWMKDTEYIRSNKKYRISTSSKRKRLTKKINWSSNLTIRKTIPFDFGIYTCVAMTAVCKKLTAKDRFEMLIYGKWICYSRFEYKVLLKSSISLHVYRSRQHIIRAPLGYLLKLRNVFPLRLNNKTPDIIFFNRDYNKSFRAPFQYCYESVKRFHKLDKIQIHQFSETTFCTFLYYGTYLVQTQDEKGHPFLHPNSLSVFPMIDISAYFHINSRFFLSKRYTDMVSNITSFGKDNITAFLINTIEEIVYNYLQVIEKHEYTLTILVTAILFLVEFKVYHFLLHRTRMAMGLERKDRGHGDKTESDIFLSFCEQSQTDQSFVIDKLLPYLDYNQSLKVRSCHLIQSGSHLFETYSEEIQNCKKVVILWSNDYAVDQECMQVFSAVVLGLHSNELLKLSDILILKYHVSQMPFRYSYLLDEFSAEVSDDSEDSLQDIVDFIKASFKKDERVVDKIEKNNIFRLVRYVLEAIFNYDAYFQGRVKHLIRAMVVVCIFCLYIVVSSYLN